MAINLKQLSAHLGLSQTTVSRALSGYDDVSQATRERVEQAAGELGYKPNRAARQIAIGRAEAVGIVYSVDTDYLGSPYFLEMLSGLASRFEQSNLDLMVVAAPQNNELGAYERIVRGRRVDALLVAHTEADDPRIDYLMASNMPFLAYGRTAHPDAYPWFDFDNLAGGRMTVRRLVKLGHKRIAYVHSPLRFNFALQRHQGFVDGMRKARLKVVPEMMVPGGLARRAGYAAGQRLLALSPRPTAIVADTSLGGVGVIRALLDAGVAVGTEISVLVYEGVPEDTLLSDLQVAAIVQPTPFLSGQTMGDMLLALVNERTLAPRQVLRQPEFADGNSVAAPAA